MTTAMTWMAASILNGPLPVYEARARLGVTRTHAVMRPNVLDAEEKAEEAVVFVGGRTGGRTVSDEAMAFIVANYATLTNDVIGGFLGMSPRYVAVLASRNGLRKSTTHIRAQRLAQHDRAREVKRQQAVARSA